MESRINIRVYRKDKAPKGIIVAKDLSPEQIEEFKRQWEEHMRNGPHIFLPLIDSEIEIVNMRNRHSRKPRKRYYRLSRKVKKEEKKRIIKDWTGDRKDLKLLTFSKFMGDWYI